MPIEQPYPPEPQPSPWYIRALIEVRLGDETHTVPWVDYQGPTVFPDPVEAQAELDRLASAQVRLVPVAHEMWFAQAEMTPLNRGL